MSFEKEMQVGAQRPMRAKRTRDIETTPMVQRRFDRPLTAELIEGFAETYLKYKYDNPLPTPQFHREMWAVCADNDKRFAEFLAPRGHAKSTAITEAYGLAALLFRQRDFAMILSNTWGQSVEFLGDMTLELEENEELRRDFGVYKLLRSAQDDIVVQMRDGYRFRVVARGAEQKVRGVKWNKRRPNLVLCDDLEDDEQVISKERREKFSNWFMRAVLPFGADDVLFRVSATILHFDSLAQNLTKGELWSLDNPEGWYILRYRAHRAFDDFTDLLWPEKFSEARLRSIRQKYLDRGDRDGYSQEYLNYPIAEGESFFRPEDLLAMENHDYLRPMRKYAAWDFAISTKERSDYTVCVVIGVDESGMIYVIDVRRGRWDSLQIIEEMFNVQQAHRCDVHWAEAGAIEKALGPMLYQEMRRRSTFSQDAYFVVEPIVPTKDKVTRAASWRARTRAKTVRYDKKASWWPALEEEMVRFPKGEHDDQVDPQSLLGMQLENLQVQPTQQEVEEDLYFQRFGKSLQTGRSSVTGY